MKISGLLATTFTLFLYSHSVTAGTITDNYTNGDTLTTTILNNIKSAVNDNNSSKQARIKIQTIGEASFGATSETFTGTSSYDLLKNVSSFVKNSSTSILLITYSDSLLTNNAQCSLQVRVGGNAPDGGTFAAPGHTTLSTVQDFFSSTGTFSGLAAGTYDIDLYKRVLSSSSCTRDSGNWSPSMTIIEIEP